MLEAVPFSAVFIGFFVLRGIAATIFFYFILADDAQCPMCNERTIRVEARVWNRLMPWFRTSWCYQCGWEGLLRPVATEFAANTESHAGQLPLSSKKSS